MKKLIVRLSLMALLLSACNLPKPQEPISVNDQAATIVAKTLTAAAPQTLLASPTAESPTEENLVPLATPTLENVPTPQPTFTPTAATGTPTATVLTVDSNTNCREGPGTSYTIVIQLVPGTTYQMIARSADNKYWIVTEIGKSAPCWVPAEMSNAFGNVNLLPATTPAAPTSAAAGELQAPSGLYYQYSCSFNGVNTDITVTLTWTDRSKNETGFRVYRDGIMVEELPANTATYKETFAGSAAATYSYRVSAFNAAGEALGNPVSFSCSG